MRPLRLIFCAESGRGRNHGFDTPRSKLVQQRLLGGKRRTPEFVGVIMVNFCGDLYPKDSLSRIIRDIRTDTGDLVSGLDAKVFERLRSLRIQIGMRLMTVPEVCLGQRRV